MSDDLTVAPVLSTPAENFFEDPTPVAAPNPSLRRTANHSISLTYETVRTAREIIAGQWKKVGLQFPDHMLGDATEVIASLTQEMEGLLGTTDRQVVPRLTVLADTSYSTCCVDEIAAEHVKAEVVMHYGRSCLSPTSRLPVIYVFTQYELDHEVVVAEFERTFPDKEDKVVLTADVTFHNHMTPIISLLKEKGYKNLISTIITHDPMASIPNRRLMMTAETGPTGPGVFLDRDIPAQLTAEDLTNYALFHISEPPQAVLLALVSRFRSLHILPTGSLSTEDPTRTTSALLRRRFARVLTMATAGVIGILVNTLSVSNYMESVSKLRNMIAKAGKKSYTIVVGKLNPAKLANFAEIEGWVVVGCWESGLVEDDRAFYVPVVTPFEMSVALMDEEERVWGMEWWGGLEGLKLDDEEPKIREEAKSEESSSKLEHIDIGEYSNFEESAPPEFDLRTGRYISSNVSRPMRMPTINNSSGQCRATARLEDADIPKTVSSLVRRDARELALVNGVLSPGAEFLRSKRTWQGLGTDFDDEKSTVIEQGLRGVARGYVIGDEKNKV